MRKRIVAVEDEPDIAHFLRLIFERDHEITTVPDAAGLWAALREGPKPDLVILDHVLPDEMGIDVCRRLKAQPAPPPVIIVTAAKEAIAEAQACADLAVAKPFDPDALYADAQRFLNASASTDEQRDGAREARTRSERPEGAISPDDQHTPAAD
jgi:DNA-binding response OmpR family regulator